MAHSFKTNSGKKAFGVFNEPQEAGEYIHNKKAKAAYCFANGCTTNIKVGSQSNKLLFAGLRSSRMGQVGRSSRKDYNWYANVRPFFYAGR